MLRYHTFSSVLISFRSIPKSCFLFPNTPYRRGVVDELGYVQTPTSFAEYALNKWSVSPSPSSLFAHTASIEFLNHPLNNVFPSTVLSLPQLSKLARLFFIGLMLEFVIFSKPIDIHPISTPLWLIRLSLAS